MASYLLPNLCSKQEIDNIIRTTEELVLVLRFGRDHDPVCLQLDHVVSRLSHVFASLVFNMSVFGYIYFGWYIWSSVSNIYHLSVNNCSMDNSSI